MNPVRRTWWLYGFLAILAGPLLAAEYAGRVVGVADGDTLRSCLKTKPLIYMTVEPASSRLSAE